ncbi:MAG: ABC transporter ATP-binding protein [Eubacterium sp.]|jgi:ABC-2 type transport system ATP-binding protein|nr:ABC transporter ATP-binding protein [Eubacterium sp.]
MQVEFQNVTFRRKKFCLENLSFTIREGYLTALAGKNGAGKTTLFHLMLDKSARFEGNILADGVPWEKDRTERMNRIGFVSEEQKFFMEQTALENAEILQTVYYAFSMNRFEETMNFMQLSVHQALKNMSRGEYMKFQLAFAMAHETELYLLDEASAGMDPVFRKEFFRILHGLLENERCAVLMSTHIQDDIARHMDYLIRIEEGRIVSECEVQAE